MTCLAPKVNLGWRVRLLRAPDAVTSAPSGSPPLPGGRASADMDDVAALLREVGGAAAWQEAAWALFGQGFRSYVVCCPAEEAGGWEADDGMGKAVGCAQLCRLAVGGYLVLRQDFLISTVLVKEGWRRHGVGRALVDELLHRLPQSQAAADGGEDRQQYSAWAVIEAGEGALPAAFLRAAGGEPCGDLWGLLLERPLVALALLLTGGGLALGLGARVFRFAGRGARAEYSNLGRLGRPGGEPAT